VSILFNIGSFLGQATQAPPAALKKIFLKLRMPGK